ncbi:MAG: tRNA (N(6)-L-threonylcarbamoyladenosine(37)-C(2))-methylthiotransferase MtaB [Muribaculaceae bacterium]|nr:tRNA (N(6)-L-threonylcarbamoyladenosine(37)-C(2))-methylthiotransferase MtaB [Roseburia sp.]MCM1431300.1 tRNA (N(6)-L-threonylcarbamoyladenosine(37)-C(2))-methylthiotransferase MtaB [Muribaculaceae bacterium]MCM1492214.1 tRNA (N(6)-L-threonylcarbamoyladenosine(37)-C(2))-methylthiotransferase MtaB [Muribaculaceae bacterium]
MGNKRRAALQNLGCKVNAYETEAMRQLLENAGYEIVPFSEKAEVYIVNTCSVTNIADRKSRQMLHRARRNSPDALVVAAGCYVQTRQEEAREDPAIDLLIGNNQKGELIERLEQCLAEREQEQERGRALSSVPDINCGVLPFEELTVSAPAEHTRAFLKVQDGCNQFCSYCIIPYARGRVRSRPLESVLCEVERLAKNGYREVVLTGIHLSSYGVDTGDSLLHLIRSVHGVEGIARIRLGSLEPQIVTEEFVRALAELPKLCPHFHLSLQSGCDETLARMNRKYTTEEYAKACALLRRCFTHPAITTDVIVGFPGESAEEFAQTAEFLERIHFYEMHIFKYSRRQGTRAARMEGQVPESVRAERSSALLALSRRMSGEFREYYRGKPVTALLEEKQMIAGKERYVGYTPEYVRVAYESGENLENTFVSGILAGQLDEESFAIENA